MYKGMETGTLKNDNSKNPSFSFLIYGQDLKIGSSFVYSLRQQRTEHCMDLKYATCWKALTHPHSGKNEEKFIK